MFHNGDSMSKAKIPLVKESSLRGGIFLSIIKLCLEKGGRFKDSCATPEKPFIGDKSGVETCTLISSITVKDVLEKYSVPEHVTYGENGFWDSKDSVGLSFVSLEEFEMMQSEIKDIRAKSDARIAAIRAKRGMR